MLTDDYINHLPDNLIKNIQELDIYYIDLLANRLKNIKSMKESELKQLSKILLAGEDVEKLTKQIQKVTNMSTKEIHKIYETVVKDNWNQARVLADYRNKPYIPYEENEFLQNLVNSMSKITQNQFKNYSDTSLIGGYISFDNSQPIFAPIREQYISILDKAIVSNSIHDTYSNSLRNALKAMADSGIMYTYYHNENKKPYRQNIVSATRRNLRDGMSQIAQATQDYIGKQFNSDGKELSIHGNCAKDHIDIQGQTYTNKEYEEMNAGLNRQIGTKNCRHYAFSIILGVSIPQMTQKELKELNDKNTKGWTDKNYLLTKKVENESPKNYTLYEASQELRKLENTTRKLMMKEKVLRTYGDTEEADKLKTKVTEYMNRHSKLVKELEPFGVRPDNDRFII